jgi:multidrug efflux pump subunit AcrA (membrane-fusion protein)
MSRLLIVPFLLLGAACSSPLRESSEPAPTAEQPVVSPKPDVAPAAQAPVEPESQAAPPSAPPAPVMAEPPRAKPRAPEPMATPDPVKSVLAEEARRVEREQLVARLETEREAAAAIVARREKDLLAFKNPFLPRPQLTADESAEIEGLGGAARAKWAERRVAEAKAQLELAQKAYDDAKANP